MYIYDQGRTSEVSLGIGRLDAFGKSPKKKGPSPEQLEEEIKKHAAEAQRLEEQNKELYDILRQAQMENNQLDVTRSANAMRANEVAIKGFGNTVNGKYREWLQKRDKDDKVNTWSIHEMGANASKALGDAESRYERLIKALDAGPPSKDAARLSNEKREFERTYVRVDIRLARGSKKNKLEAHPGQRGNAGSDEGEAAWKWAAGKLSNEGRFQGLLMVGEYHISRENIDLGRGMALDRVSKVRLVQKKDGSFEIDI